MILWHWNYRRKMGPSVHWPICCSCTWGELCNSVLFGISHVCEKRHRHQCIFFFALLCFCDWFQNICRGSFWFNEFWCIRFVVFVWVFERFRKDYKRWLEWVHLGVEQQFLYRFWGQTDTFVWHRLVKSVSFSVVTHSQSHWHAWKRTIGACCVPYTRAASIREQYMISGWAMCSPSARPFESCTQNIHCTVLIAQRSVIYRWANGLWIQSIFYRMHILSLFYIYILSWSWWRWDTHLAVCPRHTLAMAMLLHTYVPCDHIHWPDMIHKNQLCVRRRVMKWQTRKCVYFFILPLEFTILLCHRWRWFLVGVQYWIPLSTWHGYTSEWWILSVCGGSLSECTMYMCGCLFLFYRAVETINMKLQFA